MDLAIRGGSVVTSDSRFEADLGIRDGRIDQIGGTVPQGASEIDATGKLVFPGGVDMHVHLTTAAVGDDAAAWVDDFASGSRAAAAGGVTTIGNMTFPRPGERLGEALARTRAEAEGASIVDFLLHPVLVEPRHAAEHEIETLARIGCRSIKIFMVLGSFDAHQRSYLDAMRVAASHSMVTLIHCEDSCIVGYLVDALRAAGKAATSFYAETRPPYVEAVAVARAAALGRVSGAPIYLVHISSAEALRVARDARSAGVRLTVETRPMYLHLTEEKLSGPDGALFVGNPPLRTDADRDALWNALTTGEVDTCCTDHAPWRRQNKLDPARDVGTVRAGVAELETLMPSLFSEGVLKRGMSLENFVRVTSTNAARIFGLYPRKGTVAVGSDADLVIWDAHATRTVRAADMFTNADYSIYEGWTIAGWPTVTISRGEAIFADGRILGRAGRGRFLSMASSESADVIANA
jgi:dihydropyrimidinase